MMYEWGASLNGKHTYHDYGLYITNIRQISPPEVRTTYISVPGRDGDIDLTEALAGRPIYGSRTISLELGGKKKRADWVRFRDEIENDLHGKKVQVIFDDDPEYYWEGRATIQDDYERGTEIARFTLEIKAEPYKIEQRDGGSASCWLWDTFNLHTGIIRNYYNIRVDGEYELRLIGREMPVIPVFEVTGRLSVVFKGKEYALVPGMNKIYDIVTKKGENYLTFNGTGTVTVHYRGGTL